MTRPSSAAAAPQALKALRFLEVALPLLEAHPQAWRSVQRWAAMPLLSDLLSTPLWPREHALDLNNFLDWGSAQSSSGERLAEWVIQVDGGPSGRFEDAVVLPSPWSLERLVRALGEIGETRSWGPWQLQGDHRVLYLTPLDLFVVDAGNHSFTAGVLGGTGAFQAAATEDHTALYPEVRLSPQGYVRQADGAWLIEVPHWSLAALLELGRWRFTRSGAGRG